MKHLILAGYFLKKNLKSILSFAIILFVATVMFTSGIMITTSIDDDYKKRFDELNTADVSFVVPEQTYTDGLLDKIRATENVSDVETARGIMLSIPVQMNGMEQNQNQIFYRLDDIKNISKLNTISSTDKNLEHAIYIPYYLSANSDLALGSDFSFTADGTKYEFRVKGVMEEMQYGNYSSSVLGEYLPADSYEYLKEHNSDKETRTIFIKSSDEEQTLKDVSKILIENHIPILNKSRASVKKQSRLSVSNILVLILLAFAVIILFISLVVTRFKIKQTLEEDLTNMGVLKSLGYKSHEIITGIVLPYVIATLVFSGLGIVLATPVLGLLGNVISTQAGFVWEPQLNIVASLIIVISIITLITVSTYLSTRKIKKLKPIEAIRGIGENETIKNPFPIAKTKGNVNFIMALKNFANSISGNILLGTILLLTTILASFVVTLFYNVNVSPENFVNTLVEEHPTVMVKQRENIKDEIAKDYKTIYYDENCESVLDGNSYKTFVAETFESMANDLVFEGSNPKNSDEVAVGSSLKEKYDYKIGDKIKLSSSNSHEYTITGFVQSVNNAGEVIEMTIDGYKNINEDYEPDTLYIYLDDETEEKATKLIEDLEAKYGDKIEQTVNYVSSMNSAVAMFISLIKIITIVIIIIALLVIYLVLNILLSGLIMSKKLELGVLKSVGFRTRQLVIQIVGGFMPSIIVFVLLGAVISSLCMNNVFDSIFSMVGAYKVSFEYPLFIFFGSAAFLAVSAILIGVILSMKIKRITVYSLIKES
ncbi:MAG: ABC transporter permease [Candidatus Saccharibacteria bacterium]|nr:ABC transporter permease [Candidatus Saccharibacteria bacterium]